MKEITYWKGTNLGPQRKEWMKNHLRLEEIQTEPVSEKEIEDLMFNIEVAILEGAYEPSESGAGYSATNDARENAFIILRDWLQQRRAPDKWIGYDNLIMLIVKKEEALKEIVLLSSHPEELTAIGILAKNALNN